MHLYETAIVFDSQSKAEEIEDRINNVNNFITNHGGQITSSNELGKKRLAYEINKKQYGYYVFIRFTGPGQLISLLEREYRLSENILRYLTLKVDKKQIQAEQKIAEATAAAEKPRPSEPVNETTDSKKTAAQEEVATEAVAEESSTPTEAVEAPAAEAEADQEVEKGEETAAAEKSEDDAKPETAEKKE